MLFNTALQNLPHGLVMFDANDRLIICNGRYAELYGLAPERMQPGASLRDVIDARVAAGSFPPNPDKYAVDRLAALSISKRCSFVDELTNGRVFSIVWQPMPDGGSIAIHQDITERHLAETRAAEAHRQVTEKQYAIDQAVIVAVTDVTGRITYVNDNFCRISGYAREELVGANHRILNSGVHREQFFRDIYRQIAAGRVWRGEVCNRANDGSLYWVDTTIVPQLGPSGKPVACMALRIDITARKRAEAELRETHAFLDAVINNLPITIMAKGAHDHRFVLVNRALETVFKIPIADVIGKRVYDVIAPGKIALFNERDSEVLEQRKQKSFEFTLEADDGAMRRIKSIKFPILGEDGEPQYIVTLAEDITDRQQALERIEQMARHDSLTGLANRTSFLEKIHDAGARLRRSGETFSVLMLDLDRFKHINDSLGHPAGDELLKETAERLRSSLRETDVVARLGGDEFAIIQSGAPNQREAAMALAIKVVEIVGEPLQLDGQKVSVGASIGIALAPDDGIAPDELLKMADLALYRTKAHGRNGFSFFQAEMTIEAEARHRLEIELREAVLRDELELHYQPVVDVKSRRTCAVEALVRWRHPTDGLIFPDRFIGLAEDTGLIVPIGEWVLQKACADASSWPEHIRVAVNLSPAQFRKRKLFEIVLAALVQSGLAPERLELEITESVLMENDEEYLVVINQLKNLGVMVALDDFGTGYSSLTYLTRLPFDKIKIDRSFTQDLYKSSASLAVVSSVVTLARGLDIVITAEGVEFEDQFDLFRAMGIDLVQGYLFGPPCPNSELEFSTAPSAERAGEAA